MFRPSSSINPTCGAGKEALEATGARPENLRLEITESMIMENVNAAKIALAELAALNIRVSIDDFGTGYSSLSYLNHFPVHALKIDRSFVRAMEADPIRRRFRNRSSLWRIISA